jgi:hypothetical protein
MRAVGANATSSLMTAGRGAVLEGLLQSGLMDTAFSEDLAGRLVRPNHQAQRPTARRLGPRLHDVIDVGKHGLALEGIAGMLAEGKSCHHRPGARRHAGPIRSDER